MTGPDLEMTKTDRNLWSAIVEEALAHLKYIAYAQRATDEGHPEVAQVLQEVAEAETTHGVGHLVAVRGVKSTLENLRDVIALEAREAATLYPRMIREAIDERRGDAVETFTRAMEDEDGHLAAFSRVLEGLEAKLRELPGVASTDEAPPPAPEEGPEDGGPIEAPSIVMAAEAVERERWRVAAATRIREVVFGAQDGLLSTVALVTSVAATGAETVIVLVAGLATALAGMISMGTGSYLGSKAARDVQRAEVEREAREIEEHPAEELAELVVLYQMEGMTRERAERVAEEVAANRGLWLRTMVEKELGISVDVATSPLKDGLTMGVAFIVAAMVPIVPYFVLARSVAVPVSVVGALLGLFALGAGKGRLVNRSPVMQGLEVLGIGTAAAALAFALGDGIPRLFS